LHLQGSVSIMCVGFGNRQIELRADEKVTDFRDERREGVAAFSAACAPVQVLPYRL
jgi:hypothetical protein